MLDAEFSVITSSHHEVSFLGKTSSTRAAKQLEELLISKAKPTASKPRVWSADVFSALKGGRTNICATEAASKMLFATLDHPLPHQLSLWSGSQAGKAKTSREMQGLKESGDNLRTMYVRGLIGSKGEWHLQG